MWIRVYFDNSRAVSLDVEIDFETTCSDVVNVCKQRFDDEEKDAYYLAELCMGYERTIEDLEKPYEILQQWGNHRDKVHFFLRHRSNISVTGHVPSDIQTRNRKAIGSSPEIQENNERMQNEALKQQCEIEQRRFELAKKSEHLAALKQQRTSRRHQLANVNERLNDMQERMDKKSTKLKKLKELRDLAQKQKNNNNNISIELESMKENFSQKEQHLVDVIAKVEMLAKELTSVKGEGDNEQTEFNDQSLDKNKLIQQISDYNKFNDQHINQISVKQESLMSCRKQIDEVNSKIVKIHERINSKCEERDQKKKLVHITSLKGSRDFSNGNSVDVIRLPSKHDSKYQSLPYSLKFSNGSDNSMKDVLKSDENSNKIVASDSLSDCSEKHLMDSGVSIDMSVRSGRSAFDLSENMQNKSGNVQDGYSNPVKQIARPASTTGELVSTSMAGPNTSHKLLSHFAPRPYGFAKTAPVSLLLPFKQNGIEQFRDQQEILITDPPILRSPLKSDVQSARALNIQSKSLDFCPGQTDQSLAKMSSSLHPAVSKRLDWSAIPGESSLKKCENSCVDVTAKSKKKKVPTATLR